MRESVMTGWLAMGPKVAAFEKAFAERHEVARAVATTSGTAALHLILAAMGIAPGDEVIVPAFTWVATANTVVHCGATPVLVDVDRRTFNIDASKVSAAITERTKAVVAVHQFGRCADFDAVAEAAEGIPIVEDAACAAGATCKGRPAGSMGLAAGFSFHPRKSITTGEGGMATTDDDALAARMIALRNHGATPSPEQSADGPKPYLLGEFDLPGFNYRMTDLQAAVGLVQLGKMDAFIDERRRWAAFYSEQFAGIDWLRTPEEDPGCRSAWQSYVCYVDENRSPMTRNEIMDRLAERGIATRPGSLAVHMLGYYRRRLGLSDDDLPAARDCFRFSLAIPLHNRMTPEDYEYVAAVVKEL